jgi:hypothetical protein
MKRLFLLVALLSLIAAPAKADLSIPWLGIHIGNPPPMRPASPAMWRDDGVKVQSRYYICDDHGGHWVTWDTYRYYQDRRSAEWSRQTGGSFGIKGEINSGLAAR